MAFRSLMDDLHAELNAHGFVDLRPAYGFVLLAARERDMSVNDVAALLGTTKQAASKLLEGMQTAGYVRRVTQDHDARSIRIALTARGEKLLGTVEGIYATLEAQWAEIIGVRGVSKLRADLEAVMRARHDGELPAVRPTW